MSLLSFFRRTASSDLTTEIAASCARQSADIINTLTTQPRKVFQWEMARQPVRIYHDTAQNIDARRQAKLALEKALRDNPAYAELRSLCRQTIPYCLVEYKIDYQSRERCVVASLVIDTFDPYHDIAPTQKPLAAMEPRVAIALSHPRHIVAPHVTFKPAGA